MGVRSPVAHSPLLRYRWQEITCTFVQLKGVLRKADTNGTERLSYQ